MAKSKFSNRLAGQIGEALVVAELGRREIVATAFAGNVPDIDLLAYRDGVSTYLQVKAWRKGSVHLNAAKFLDISMDGKRQIINGLNKALDKDLIYVFVKVWEEYGADEFFIMTQGHIQKIVHDNHLAYLRKHNGVRPKNPNSTHVSFRPKDFEEHKNAWNVIENRLC